MADASDSGEGLDQLGELRGSQNPGRRENQRSSEESRESQQSSWSKDSGYASSESRTNPVEHQQPSFQEAGQYFYGLMGRPKLIARTSTAPFVRRYESGYPQKKIVTNVGKHDLCEVYNKEVRRSIWKALEFIPWLTIDIAHIGFSGKHSLDPIVMLITVKANTTHWVKAQDAVNTCQKIIRQKGCEIEVEMKEGSIDFSFAGDEAKIVTDPYIRIPEIGQSIGVQYEGEVARGAGTLTAYIKIIGGHLAGNTYGLTCHHVVFPEYSPSPAGKSKVYKYNNGRQQFICQPATLNHNLLSRVLQNARDTAKRNVEGLLAQQKAAEEGTAKQLTQYQKQTINRDQSVMSENAIRIEVNNNFDRAFGFVAVSSGLSIQEEHQNLRDWALVELNRGRFDRRPLNEVPNLELTQKQQYDIDRNLDYEDRLKFDKIQGILISEVVSLNEVLNSTTTDTSGERSFRVLKHGRTTHWTFGVVNEIKSDCQRDPGEISTELCVLDLVKGNEFSKPGDSGALVIDYHGRAVGLVHGGGAPLSEGTEFHYVTPIEWLFADIKDTLNAERVIFSS